jgi:transcriptional regulator of aromatic amino acid metabolism
LSRLNPTLQEAVLRRLDRLAARVVLAERFDGDRDEALAAIPPMARAFVQERCGYLPPLRDRGEDVERLATGFMLRHAMLCGRPAKACSVEARHALRHRYWTGNVPELEQVVRVAVLRAGARVEAGDLPASG